MRKRKTYESGARKNCFYSLENAFNLAFSACVRATTRRNRERRTVLQSSPDFYFTFFSKHVLLARGFSRFFRVNKKILFFSTKGMSRRFITFG